MLWVDLKLNLSMTHCQLDKNADMSALGSQLRLVMYIP